MRTDASILVFAAGAFLGLALLWASSAAALAAVGVGSAVALALVRNRREE